MDGWFVNGFNAAAFPTTSEAARRWPSGRHAVPNWQRPYRIASGAASRPASHSLAASSTSPCKSVPLASAIRFKLAAVSRGIEKVICVCICQPAMRLRQKMPYIPLSHINLIAFRILAAGFATAPDAVPNAANPI
jgi:hypothetical protein